jgi:CRISPR/Cas system-associated endonuclease Cas1
VDRLNGRYTDDLMEPYRPFVDSTVRGMVAAGQIEIDKASKLAMIGVLRSPVLLVEGRYALGDAMERTASSLALSMERQVKQEVPAPAAAGELILPEPEFP